MKKHTCLNLIFFILTLSSCLSKKDLATGNSILKNDLSILNGTYKNTAANSKEPQDKISLYLLLFKNFHWQNPYYNKPDDYDGSIRLTAISNSKLKIERFIDGEIVKTKILKGKVYNNFFLTNRKWRVLGVPIIFGVYDESAIAISLAPNGYLYIKKAFETTGGIIGLGGNSNTYIEGNYFTKADSDGQEIYNETINLLNSLAKENPNKHIFYKTELHSIDSYIWYDQSDSIVSYRITPDGTKQKTIAQPHYRTLFNPKESLIYPILGSPNSSKSLIGYVEFINERIMKYGMGVIDKFVPESKRVFQNNDFIRKVNEDLYSIKREYGINYHYDYYE